LGCTGPTEKDCRKCNEGHKLNDKKECAVEVFKFNDCGGAIGSYYDFF